MHLILWRHAEAEDPGPAGDLARALTAHGRRQARRMADWLRPRLPRHCAVIASPAVRTRTTAAALQPGHALDERLAPGADAAAVLAACGWPDSGRRDGAVLVVGHQPTLGHVASLLLTGTQADWSVRKGAIWWLSTRERDAHDQVVLRAVLSPDLIGQDVA